MNSATGNWPKGVPRLLWFRHKCPCCNSIKFKPAELRPADWLLALIFLRPFRCMFCWRRYYWFTLRGTCIK